MAKLIIKKSYIYLVSYIVLLIFGIGGGVYLTIFALGNFKAGNIPLGLIVLLSSLIFIVLVFAVIIGGILWIFMLPKEIMILDDTQISWYFLKDKGSIRYENIETFRYYEGS